MLDKLWRQEETFAGFSNWSFCGISTLIVPSIGFTCTHHHMSVTPHSIGHHCDYLANGFETLLLFSWIERPHLRISLIMVIWWWLCGVYGWQKKDNSPWRPPSHSPLPDSPPSLILVATHCPIRSSLINLESHFENEIELAKAWPIKKSQLELKAQVEIFVQLPCHYLNEPLEQPTCATATVHLSWISRLDVWLALTSSWAVVAPAMQCQPVDTAPTTAASTPGSLLVCCSSSSSSDTSLSFQLLLYLYCQLRFLFLAFDDIKYRMFPLTMSSMRNTINKVCEHSSSRRAGFKLGLSGSAVTLAWFLRLSHNTHCQAVIHTQACPRHATDDASDMSEMMPPESRRTTLRC